MWIDLLYYVSLGAVVLSMMLFNRRSPFLQNNFHSLLRYDLKFDILVNGNNDQIDETSDSAYTPVEESGKLATIEDADEHTNIENAVILNR